MNVRTTGSVFAIATLAFGCAPEGDLPDQAEPIAQDLRIIGDPPIDPPPRPPRPPAVPLSSDLKMDGTMRFYGAGSSLGVQINVTNIGNIAATGPSGQVNVGGYTAAASLHQYWGGTSTAANTVNPGERGYLMAYLPLGAIAPCNRYLTHIDTSRTIQTSSGGAPDPFVNDEADVATQCLEWTTPISSNNFSISDPLINGNTIGRIVSSITVGRQDGNRCSHCHFTGSGLPYSPPVARDGNASIWPNDVIGGRTWAGPGGWAQAFIHMPTDVPGLISSKPYYLQALIQTWVDHGERFTQSIIADPGPITAFAF
jgi:hypothetical protein